VLAWAVEGSEAPDRVSRRMVGCAGPGMPARLPSSGCQAALIPRVLLALALAVPGTVIWRLAKDTAEMSR
jgi:hypothetical protein